MDSYILNPVVTSHLAEVFKIKELFVIKEVWVKQANFGKIDLDITMIGASDYLRNLKKVRAYYPVIIITESEEILMSRLFIGFFTGSEKHKHYSEEQIKEYEYYINAIRQFHNHLNP